MNLFLDRLPKGLKTKSESLAKCFKAFNSIRRINEVYIFGSYARGDARPDSDIDLCIVAEGAENQIQTAGLFRRAIRDIRPKPAFTLIPITPERLAEKKAIHDHFFSTILKEGILVATKN